MDLAVNLRRRRLKMFYDFFSGYGIEMLRDSLKNVAGEGGTCTALSSNSSR